MIGTPSINPKTRLKLRSRRPFPVGKNSCDTGRLAVSVCICTYRRPYLLAELLDSLAEQNFREPFEIIVVDNDAAGSAVTTVDNTKMRHPELNIIYSVELQKGISFARNTAVSLARGDFLAWIDDDETAAESWLMSLWATRLINDVDAVFGPVIPVFPRGSRVWPARSGLFERPRHSTGTKIDPREARTGNALVKASWLCNVASPFDPKLANCGGEDYDFFARIADQGARFEWCDEAEVFEMVPFERQRLAWILERRLRASTYYWRSRSASRVRMVIRASAGGVACIVFAFAGVIMAPFAFHRAVRLWCLAMNGLGRAVAISGVQWKGY
ncbi:Glycosyl transferase family 2 [Nitrosospira sp. Nsp14]|uniref:glycosyltransferase n=1 Tax=Nitrosospira sp. Nsp14 TaxID=1855333 RepID=UPI0008F2A6E3|nr:glycosyltransferase family 2 protein [Nitrosospira sp. Nsp14]SFH17834.1 Glycosyl transferase family 2 [Nitrosospira sp. Nsp14]